MIYTFHINRVSVCKNELIPLITDILHFQKINPASTENTQIIFSDAYVFTYTGNFKTLVYHLNFTYIVQYSS